MTGRDDATRLKHIRGSLPLFSGCPDHQAATHAKVSAQETLAAS